MFNKVKLTGFIDSEFTISHKYNDSNFLCFNLSIPRNIENNKTDCIPVIISEKDLLRYNINKEDNIGKLVEIIGEYHSYNQFENGIHHLKLFCLAKRINILENIDININSNNKNEIKNNSSTETENKMINESKIISENKKEKQSPNITQRNVFNNYIYLNGYICKKVNYKILKDGNAFSDIIIACNRPNNKSDYIPCIAWNDIAETSKNLQIGSNVIIEGSIQSRIYLKNNESKTAYEVLINKLTKVNGTNKIKLEEK